MTNQQQHTPGPWRPGNAGLSVKTEDGYWIADLQLSGISYAKAAINDTQRIANAHLIAAAPDMLETLKYFAEWFPQSAGKAILDNYFDCEDYGMAYLQRVKDVIAKVEGAQA